MRSRFVSWALVGAIVFFVGAVPGCRSGDDFPNSIDGGWGWMVTRFLHQDRGLGTEDLTGCILDGILTDVQSFDIADDGVEISASFVDTEDNEVTLAGTYVDGRLNGVLTVMSPGGRVVVVDLVLIGGFGADGMPMLDGTATVTADSDDLCVGAEADVWMMEGPAPAGDEVFEQCGSVDVVIIMDTSGSMEDEALALCEKIDGVVETLNGLGLADLRVFKWGITEDRNVFIENEEFSNAEIFSCLDNNVRDIFGNPEVPGLPGRFLNLGDSDEDWGPAIAIIAELGTGNRSEGFQFRPDAVKVIIAISDEGPSNGNDPLFDGRGDPDPTGDKVSIDNAIIFANARNVIVSPIIANSTRPHITQLGLDIAAATGGVAARSANPSALDQLLFDIVLSACGGTPEQPPAPPQVGETILIAHSRNVLGIHTINPETGASTFLCATPIEQLGVAELDGVSSMIFNEKTRTVWAGMGSSEFSTCGGCIFEISSDCIATEKSRNTDTNRMPGLAQRRTDLLIFGMEHDNDQALLVIDNMTGDGDEYADDLDVIEGFGVPGDNGRGGRGITAIGNDLYVALDDELWKMDGFTGQPTLVDSFTLIDFPEITNFTISAMTTRPSDNKVFGILRDRTGEGRRTFLCEIDIDDANVRNIGQNDTPLDGLTWVPAGYFNAR